MQEGNISSYRQVAITVPGRYSLAWQDGLFMSEADLQARKRSFHSRPRRKRGCPSCPRQETRAILSRAKRKQVVLSGLSRPQQRFYQANRVAG